jgi:polyhydroxybutyrate depolymerase
VSSPDPPSKRRRTALQLGCLLTAALILLGGSIASTAGVSASQVVAGSTAAAGPVADADIVGAVSVAAVLAKTPGVTITLKRMEFDGLNRGYLVVTPVGQTGPLPMIVTLHGINASPTQELLRDELLPLVQAGKAVLVYPAGYKFSWNVGADDCCGSAGTAGVDDVAFVSAVVTATEASLPVTHAYLLGFSNGGKLAYQVMCQEPQIFDAFAVVAAAALSSCSSTSPPATSVLIAVGAQDPELPTKQTAEPAAAVLSSTAELWRARDGCSSAGSSSTVLQASVQTWAGCSGGTSVTAVLYSGIAHIWPNAGAVGGAADSGATLVWSFFSAQSGAQDPG